MYIKKNQVLERPDHKPMVIDTFYSKEKTNQPIIIFCHGYKGFKDWGAWNIMAKKMAQAGFCFIKFNFSHNGGTIENPIDFPDLEAFGHNNYTKELDDLDAVINWTKTHFDNHAAINTTEIYLIGHSRGGGIALLKTAEDKRIKKLITLASICDFEKRTATTGDLENWKKDGVKYITNGRTKQQMPHYYQFYEDFIANKARLDIKNASQKIAVPHLIIHGIEDTSVPIAEAENLHKWNSKSILLPIKNADHVFNTKQPWKNKTLSKELLQVVDASLAFFNAVD